MRLNSKSIEDTVKQLEKYKNSLAVKNEIFVMRLLDEGIKVAQENVSGFGKYITFTSDIEGDIHCIGKLIAADSQKIESEWDYFGERKTATLSPTLLSEFGSASLAEVLFPIEGVGQGTFPGQTHAFDEGGWWYKEWQPDNKGKWKRGNGIKPTHPMYFADMQMKENIKKIAKEVFSDGS